MHWSNSQWQRVEMCSNFSQTETPRADCQRTGWRSTWEASVVCRTNGWSLAEALTSSFAIFLSLKCLFSKARCFNVKRVLWTTLPYVCWSFAPNAHAHLLPNCVMYSAKNWSYTPRKKRAKAYFRVQTAQLNERSPVAYSNWRNKSRKKNVCETIKVCNSKYAKWSQM